MKTIRELRDELSATFAHVKTGKITPKVAKELNNGAGKIIATARAELEYFALRKEKPSIPFLDKAK